MKIIQYFKFSLILLFVNTYAQNSKRPTIPSEVSQWNFVIGEWTATNKSIMRDGSGKYKINKGLKFVGKELFDGYGHQVDWYGPDGSYWGTSLRTFNRTSKKWESRWFDIVTSSWQDLYELEFKDGNIVHESEGIDNFGKFKTKRVYKISENGKTYEYEHLRKYENMGSWMLIDGFVANKL